MSPDIDLLTHRIRAAQTDEPRGLIVFLHGRGADENDLYPVFDILDPHGESIGVTPRGPLSLPPGGAHWYVSRAVGYPDANTFRETFELLARWLEALCKTTGVPLDRTVLGGFSQGAVMAYSLALGAGREPPAALVAFSGFIPEVEGCEIEPSNLRGRPVAIGHGIYDPVIGVEWGTDARARLESAGALVTYRESPMPHAIDPHFLRELRPWLHAVVESAPVREA